MMGQARLSVLIVDDEPLIRRSIRRIVTAREDTVIAGECETGAQATAAIREHRPDLVLLDVQMHSGTGLEVVEQIGPENMPASFSSLLTTIMRCKRLNGMRLITF
jgi:two-component system, LytTR family, response regulator